MPTNPEIPTGSDQRTPETYKFSTYEQLQAFLKAKGWENDQVWALFRGTGVQQQFPEISLTEEQITDLAKRLQELKTRFEQQSLLRTVIKNKLREEIDSITFANPQEVCEALKQRGVDYPYEYLTGDPSNSSFLANFKGPRTLSRTQYERLISDLNAISGNNALVQGKRGELIRSVFLGTGTTSQVSAAGRPSEGAALGPQKVLVDEFYPSREEATKKAFEGATSFPIIVKYSEGGKSYEYQISTSGNKMSFSGKDISFGHKSGNITSISFYGENIVFSDANGKPLFSIDRKTFASEVSSQLLSRNEPKLLLFGDIQLGVGGSISSKNIATPKVEKELSGDELRDYIFTLARKELESVSGNIEQLTPEGLEQVIQAFTTLGEFKWLEKFPGLKEKARELLKLDTTMEGVLGAGFLKALEAQGYKLGFIAKGKVAVEHVNKNPNARDIETKINMHLSKNPTFSRMLQIGMIYKQPSFESYRQSVTDERGELINPAKTDLRSYIDYIRRRGGAVSPSDSLFLRTAGFLDKDLNFPSIVSHGKDYNSVLEMMAGMNTDDSIRRMLGGDAPVRNGRGGTRDRAEPPAGAAGAPDRGGSSGAVGEVGKGIGKIGGFIGKIAEAGAGGGLRVLGDIFQEASKAGGAYGTLAVIGLIGYSMFGKKGLGFWGTLAAIFGIGIADTIAKGGLKGVLGDGNGTPGSQPAAAPAPAPAPSAALPAVAPGATPAAPRASETPAAPPEKPLTETSFIARAVGRENIHDADVESERAVVLAVKKMNFEKLQAALSKGDEASWQAAVNSTGYKPGSSEYNTLAQAIHANNEFGRKTLVALVGHIANSPHFKAIEPANRAGLSVEQAMEYIIKKENEKKQEDANGTFEVERSEGAPPIPPGHPTVRDILRNNEAYGNLVILSRMVEYGYLPKINYTAAEVIGGGNSLTRFLRGFVWVGLGGPLSNNVPGANWFSGKYRVHEENFYASVKNLINEEKAVLKKEVPSLPDEAVFHSMREEVKVRNAALVELEEAIAGKDASKIKSALEKYRETAKTPLYKGRIDKEKFAVAERQSITAIEAIHSRIEQEFNTWKQAQDIANSPNATPEQRKAALDATTKYNQSVMELEAHGVKQLQLLSPETREVVMKENPWASKVATANGGIAKLNGILGKAGSHWAGKSVLGVGLLGLIWENKGGVAELWNKGDYATLSKMGWDLVAGAVPVLSSFHETAMLSNAAGYRDFILGKGYEMNTLEKGFRVAGAIPLGLSLTTLSGKLALKAGARTAGQAVVGVSEIIGNSVKTIGTLGTYGFLGYQAAHVAYSIPMHLTDKK